jgi:uncharacterized RDD family membrane protein YckC
LNMESNNLFLKIYRKKSSEELLNIALGDFDDNSRLTSFTVLRERDEMEEQYQEVEKKLIEKIHNHTVSLVAEDRYSTFFDRLGSNFVDGMVIGILGFVLKHLHLTDSIESVTLLSVIGFFSGIFPFLYNIVLHASGGQTIGKMFMRIKVFDKSEKKVISFTQAFLRDSVPIAAIIIMDFILPEIWPGNIILILAAIRFVLILLIVWSMLEVVTLLFNRKRRALHDYIAGTVVLKLTDI